MNLFKWFFHHTLEENETKNRKIEIPKKMNLLEMTEKLEEIKNKISDMPYIDTLPYRMEMECLQNKIDSEIDKKYHSMCMDSRENVKEDIILRLRAKREIFPNLRHAAPNDYKEWLRGHINAGGKITHFYDYPMKDNFYVAKESFSTDIPLYGAQSINVIVPIGIKVEWYSTGHCNIYDMDGFGSPGFVPCFSDTVKVKL